MKVDLNFKKEHIPKLMVLIVVILAGWVLFKAGAVFGGLSEARQAVDVAVEQSRADSEQNLVYFAKSKALADELRKRNVFSPPPPSKKQAVQGVSGIFGDEVLINGKWYKVGDKIDEAEVVAINPTEVRIMIDGTEKVFAPITANGATEPNAQRSESVDGRRSERDRSERDRGGRDRGRDEADRGNFQEQRDRYRNMSEEERNAFREQMRDRFRNRMR